MSEWINIKNRLPEEEVRFLFKDSEAGHFVYRPPNAGIYEARDATIGVKFAQMQVITDEWYLFGGTRWSRFVYRLKHPIVYSKRGWRKLYRRIKRIFVKDRPRICKKQNKEKI